MNPRVHKHKVRNEWKWVVSRFEDGKRVRSFYASRAAADAEASRLRTGGAEAGPQWESLSGTEQQKIMAAYRESQRRGIDLMVAVVGSEKPEGQGPFLSQVVEECIEAKTKAGRSESYLHNLSIYLGRFAKNDRRIGMVTPADVEAFLDGMQLASRPTVRARISTLFKFAIRRGYVSFNPCSRLEPITLPRRTPPIFTLSEVEKCLQTLTAKRRMALPWFVLSCFCGLRPEEASKTRRQDIHFSEGWVKVEAQTSKVLERRVVYPREEAMAALKRSLKHGGRLPLSYQAKAWTIQILRRALGWPRWKADVTRHTAASNWLAACESTAAVAKSLGNSESVLLRHYAALVTRQQAKEFWATVQALSVPNALQNRP